MNTPIVSPRTHVRHEALEFGGEVASLAPARATGDELRQTMADPIKRQQIAKALDEIIFPRRLPTAIVDVGGGRKASITLLADAVGDGPHVPLSS